MFSYTFVSAESKELRETPRHIVSAKKKARLWGGGPLLVGDDNRKGSVCQGEVDGALAILGCSSQESEGLNCPSLGWEALHLTNRTLRNLGCGTQPPFLFQNGKDDGGGVLLGVVDAFGGFLEVSGGGFQDVDEFLGVTVGQGEPGTLDLHHDAMTTAERVEEIRHGEVQVGFLARRERADVEGEDLWAAIAFPRADDVERVVIEEHYPTGPITRRVAERADIDPFGPAVHRVRARVAGLAGHRVCFDDLHDSRVRWVRLRIDDVEPGRPQARNDEVAAFDVRVVTSDEKLGYP